MDADLLAAHDAQVEAFIAYNPMTAVLRRRSRVADGAGGTTGGPEANLAPQTFRLVPQAATQLQSVDGDVAYEQYTLVIMRTGDIRKGDRWSGPGGNYKVTGEIRDWAGWGIQAAVVKEEG